MQIEKEHSEMVGTLAKRGELILASMTPLKMHCLHMAVGVAGECGEIQDAMGWPIDRENVMEELGDAEFYMEGVRQGYGIDRDDTLAIITFPHGNRVTLMQYATSCSRKLNIAGCDLLDRVKKNVIYNKEPDIDHIKQDLCTLEFYMAALRVYFKMSREDILAHNIDKLIKGKDGKPPRYHGGQYSDEAAQTRADKA